MQRASLIQGVFYVASGLWPVFHLRSFEAVTGPKVDKWLVRTLGGLIAAVGAALIAGSIKRARTEHVLAILGVGSAIALATSDLAYASRGRISKVYYADAATEAAILAAWTFGRAR